MSTDRRMKYFWFSAEIEGVLEAFETFSMVGRTPFEVPEGVQVPGRENGRPQIGPWAKSYLN